MPRIEQSPIYLVMKSESGYALKKIHRSLSYSKDGKDVARFERMWFIVYEAHKLLPLLRSQGKKRRRITTIDGVDVVTKEISAMQFIKDWDTPVGRYKTFSEGGW